MCVNQFFHVLLTVKCSTCSLIKSVFAISLERLLTLSNGASFYTYTKKRPYKKHMIGEVPYRDLQIW